MRGTCWIAVAILLGFAWLTPCSAWHYVGLSGRKILSVDNHDRDNCYAASDYALFRGYSRGGWWDTLYRYEQHPETRACVRAQWNSLDSVFLAWGWGSRSDGLWFSPDGGDNWSVLRYMLFPSIVATTPANSNLVFLGSDTMEQGLWRSTDKGQSWLRADSGLPTTDIRALMFSGATDSHVVCGTRGHGLYVSTNLGTSWSAVGPDSLMDVHGVDHWYPSYLLIVGDVESNPSRSGIWLSPDLGATWRQQFGQDSGLCLRRYHAGFGRGMYTPRADTLWELAPGWPPGLPATCISSYMYGFYYAGSPDGVYHHDETPGTEETENRDVRIEKGGASIVRGVLRLGGGASASLLLDATGRKVMKLGPGANDVRSLVAGIYFVRQASCVERQASGVTKVMVAR